MHNIYLCVREIIILWMVIVFTQKGWLSDLKIEKEMRMDSKSFPTKVWCNTMEGFGRFPFLISYACTIYMCVCVRERLLFYEWSLSSLDRDGFQSLKLKKRRGWILSHFPLKWSAILWRGLGDSLSPFLTHALYIYMCVFVCERDYCFMNGHCPHLTGMAFRA